MTGFIDKGDRDKERMGLFGGTFNPIHSGHLEAALVVQKTCTLNKVLFVPSFIPPHKESGSIVSAAHRLNMIRLAIEGFPGFIASAVEIEARGKSYSILTLKKIKTLYPKALFYFILGIDGFQEIETWKEYRGVLDQCSFIVISRPGYRLENARKVLGEKYKERILDVSDKETIRTNQNEMPKIYLLPFDALDVSSTAIRERLGKGLSIAGMVPPQVNEYIHRNKLYQ
jgi:nicotinate-nucleotide adenylyltransferase